MVIFLLFKAKRVRNPAVDCFIPEQPAALRRATLEHTPNTHPKLILSLRAAACKRYFCPETDKKTVSNDSKSCQSSVSRPVFIANCHVLYSISTNVTNTSHALFPTLSLACAWTFFIPFFSL